MKRILPVLIACHCAFAIQAPTITGIVALSDTAVRLVWHSNDPATQGFYILRIDPGMSFSRGIDTLPAADTEYIDIVLPGETYGYGIAAFSSGEVSKATPYTFIQIPGIKRIFLPPGLSGLWDTAIAAVRLRIADNATSEIGFRILRAENFGMFSERAAFTSDNPVLRDTLRFTDSTVKVGAWYSYRVIVYNNSKKDSSVATVFAYPKNPIRTTKRLALGSKVSDFPVRFGNWALMQGDTICVQQDGAPFDSCTLIDVGDKQKPLFAGRVRNSVPLRLQEPQSYASLDNILLYRNGGRMVQYRFFNGAVDSLCSVPLYNQPSMPPAVSVGQVVGTLNANVAVTRYVDDKYFYYDTHFFSQEKLVPLGTIRQGGFGMCNEVTFLFFRAGKVYDYWLHGFQNGSTCDMSHPVQQVYLSYDFAFDPRSPEEAGSETAPDTMLREFNGYLASDTMVKKSKAVFVDSVKSLLYLFNDTILSIYHFSLVTSFSHQLQKPASFDNRFNIRYISAGRRVLIGYDGTVNETAMRIKLFSLKGALLFAGEIGPGKNVRVPDGISGIVLVRIDTAHQRTEGKVIIAR